MRQRNGISVRTHSPPCPGLGRSRDTSRYTLGTGEGGVGAAEPHHDPAAAAPPPPGPGPARDPPPLRRSQLAASPGALFCMGRAYWPRPARAGQAYVSEAAIGQAARELRVPCVSPAGHGGHPGNKAQTGAGCGDSGSWHCRVSAKRCPRTAVPQQHLPL